MNNTEVNASWGFTSSSEDKSSLPLQLCFVCEIGSRMGMKVAEIILRHIVHTELLIYNLKSVI